MQLNEVAILGLAVENNNENSTKYLSMVEKDQQLLSKVHNFLNELKSNKDMQHELEELKVLRFQQAHLLAQKQLTKIYLSLKSVDHLLKKAQSITQEEALYTALTDCVKSYLQIDADYKKMHESISDEIDSTPEIQKINEKLETSIEDLKTIHSSTHKSVKERLARFCTKFLEDNDLPIKKKNAEVSLSEKNVQRLKELLDKIVQFSQLEKRMSGQLTIDAPQVDFISSVFLSKIFKSLDYHFLSKSELNVVDKPEWMVSFIEETLFANINFLKSLNLEANILEALVHSFLASFYQKLSQRFQQDSNFFLEHEFLFTNFLVCLNEHAFKVNSFLSDKDVPLQDAEVYNLANIYQGKTEYLEKMIAGELREFNAIIYEKIDTMEIVIKDVPDKQKFDISLAETLENFVLLYQKNLKKYNATSSTDYISRFVRENMLDKSVRELITVLKRLIHDTEEAALAARFYIMDSILSVSEYANTELKNLEEFVKSNTEPGYDKEFQSIKDFVQDSLKSISEEFWRQNVKILRGFLNFKPTLNAFSSNETVNADEVLTKEPIPEVKAEFSSFIAAAGEKLQEPCSSFALSQFLDCLNEFILNKILKEYKFTTFGLGFVKVFALHLCEEMGKVNQKLYKNQEKKMDEIIKFMKSDKNVQFQLIQKLNSLDEGTHSEEAKVNKKQTAIQNFGYSHLTPKNILILYDAHILL